MQIHACMLALETGRPVKMVYNREESFYGHVHRHPAKMRYEHGATRDGELVFVRARPRLRRRRLRLELQRRLPQRRDLRLRPLRRAQRRHREPHALHQQPPVRRDARLRRGPGLLRPRGPDGQARRRARDGPGRAAPQERHRARDAVPVRPGGAAPGAGARDPGAGTRTCRCRRKRTVAGRDLRELPGGVSNVTHGEGVRRGVGYAVGFKNIGFSAGFDDYSTARVIALGRGRRAARARSTRRRPRSGRGSLRCRPRSRAPSSASRASPSLPADTRVGSAGSTSASRQSYVTGAAVKEACETVRERVFELVGRGVRRGRARSRSRTARSCRGDEVVVSLVGAVRTTRRSRRPSSTTTRRRSRWTRTARGTCTCSSPSRRTGRSSRSTPSSGLVRVVEVATAQDVGKVMNPQALEGQIEGGIAQGLGLALLEEIQIKGGQDPERLLHGLPDPDHPRHARGEDGDPGARRPGGSLRPQGRRRTADHRLDPGHSRRPARRHGARALAASRSSRSRSRASPRSPPEEPPQPGSAGYAEIGRLDERKEH